MYSTLTFLITGKHCPDLKATTSYSYRDRRSDQPSGRIEGGDAGLSNHSNVTYSRPYPLAWEALEEG